MDEAVLDASAVLALVKREPGWENVEEVKRRFVSAVNLAEVGSVLAKAGYGQPDLEVTFAALRLSVVDFDRHQAMEVSRLHRVTEQFGFSLGDRACIALGTLRGLPIVTAERTWKGALPR
ncbi:MAG TPA: type II toxin-antitoxin system VapC family toxin, partial [Dehalococcoidia bacterium]